MDKNGLYGNYGVRICGVFGSGSINELIPYGIMN
jgi:hypothetical protein